MKKLIFKFCACTLVLTAVVVPLTSRAAVTDSALIQQLLSQVVALQQQLIQLLARQNAPVLTSTVNGWSTYNDLANNLSFRYPDEAVITKVGDCLSISFPKGVISYGNGDSQGNFCTFTGTGVSSKSIIINATIDGQGYALSGFLDADASTWSEYARAQVKGKTLTVSSNFGYGKIPSQAEIDQYRQALMDILSTFKFSSSSN